LGFEEHRTSDLVAAKLAEWGIEVHRGLAGTGVVGVLRGTGDADRAIGLRADMDCLPMEEANDFAHRSRNPGRMHACGHDGHTTMLLGAAKYLAETRNFSGTVNFIFQPAEEGGGGGRIMVEEGLFERFPCDAVYGVHNDPWLPLGESSAVAGTIMAAADGVKIRVRGKGGHAAQPHRAIDPVLVGAQIVVALQGIVSRRVDPLDSAVLSLCKFHAGSAGNVIPEVAEIEGTIRTLKQSTREEMQRLVQEVAPAIAAGFGAEAVVEIRHGYPPTTNHAAETDRAALALARVMGEEKVLRARPPVMGAEDFSYMVLARPGAFLKLGQRQGEAHGVSVHHPRYDFNDALLPIGASFFAALVEQELPRG
jgi:hippurate hydrolase